eukprot:4999877-Amphidinium_carterae.1
MKALNRKRQFDVQVWPGHRQAALAAHAAGAGSQFKRGALPPLLPIECEPGDAIRRAMSLKHPLCQAPAFDPDLANLLNIMLSTPDVWRQRRANAFAFWQKRALFL